MTRTARAWAPATIANVGPGFDVLGLAVEHLGITVTIETDTADAAGPGPWPRLVAVTGYDAERIPTDPARNGAVIAARLVFEKFEVRDPTRLIIGNALPFAGGLGGSAASAVAGAAAALEYLGQPLAPSLLMESALETEARLSGRHLDNIAAAVLGGLTLVLDAETLDAVRIRMHAPWFVVLVTPRTSIDTKTARQLLPETWPRSQWVPQMARTAAVVQAFATGDATLLGRAFHDEFAEPVRAPLIPGFASIRGAALDAGAFACSISGSGPTVFAIAEGSEPARGVAKAMAAAAGEDLALVSFGAIAAQGARAL